MPLPAAVALDGVALQRREACEAGAHLWGAWRLQPGCMGLQPGHNRLQRREAREAGVAVVAVAVGLAVAVGWAGVVGLVRTCSAGRASLGSSVGTFCRFATSTHRAWRPSRPARPDSW